MAHFAQLDDNNNIIQVIVVNNDVVGNLSYPESEPLGIDFCKSLFGQDTNWLQTSYNNNFRRQYAATGGSYYTPLDVFVDPKPFPSWSFREEDATWQAPVPKPEVSPNCFAVWNEDKVDWDIICN